MAFSYKDIRTFINYFIRKYPIYTLGIWIFWFYSLDI